MPASGKKEVMSEAEIEQRRQAGMKKATHGAYAFRDRGEAALEAGGRTRLSELREIVKDRDGVLHLMQEKAADAVMIFEIVQSHVAGEAKSGRPLDRIPVLKSLPAFMNSMQRALSALIALMPREGDRLDADVILKAVKEGKNDNETTDG
jgi:hypothetical protein